MNGFANILARNPVDSATQRAQVTLSFLAQLFLLPALGWHFALVAAGTPVNDAFAPVVWWTMIALPALFLYLSWGRPYVRRYALTALSIAILSTVLGQGWVFTAENAPWWLGLLWFAALFGLLRANTE